MRRSVIVALVGCVAAAACGSGRSILDAGNEPRPTTTTAAPQSTLPGETVPTTVPPTTTTTPLASLPPCPVDALEDITEPVQVTFWHGLSADVQEELTRLTEEYHAGQDRVRVSLEFQGGYKETIDKYVQSSQGARPALVLLPEYMLQQLIDSASTVPMGACIEGSGFDTSAFLPGVLRAWATQGVQWAMPFNISDPVLYFNKRVFAAAGLDPEQPPRSIEELRAASEAIVASGAATYGLAVDSGVDSGGGWFLEQWFAKAGQFYADNGNGRLAPATRVLYAGPTGVELLTALQTMIADGLAVTVGDNTNGQDALLKLADPAQPAAMTIASSGALGTVINVLNNGLIPTVTGADLGIGPMPGPGDDDLTLVGGAAIWIVNGKGDAATAAAWDYIQFLVDVQTQSTWASETGYTPVRQDALELDPVKTTFTADPRFRVAYDQLLAAPADDPTAVGPVIGPLREVRGVTASAVAAIFNGADVATSLTAAAAQSDTLIADYNAFNN